jgi:hypothetical protein
MDHYEKLKELDKEIKMRHPENAVLDGIVDFYDDNFDKAKKKILWILKEPNMGNLKVIILISVTILIRWMLNIVLSRKHGN